MPILCEAKENQSTRGADSLPRQWLDHHGDALYAYALRRVRRPEVAEDLVQETLLAGLQAWHRFEGSAQVRTWLIGILRNKITDHLRARYRHDCVQTRTLEEDEMFTRRGAWKAAVPRWRGDPHQLVVDGEFNAVLGQCLAKLPTRMAYLFLSRVSDDTDTEALCGELKITPENAWMLLHRARSRLQQCLTANWFTPPTSPKAGNSCAKPLR